jgi:hypothetical protein
VNDFHDFRGVPEEISLSGKFFDVKVILTLIILTFGYGMVALRKS